MRHRITIYDWQTGIDIYWTGTGFANGNVRLFYSGIPNAPDGWRYGGTLRAAQNRLTAARDTTFDESYTQCTAAQISSNVVVVAVDGHGIQSRPFTMPARVFCANGGG